MIDKYQEAIAQLPTIRDWIRWGVSEFESAHLCYGHGTDNPWDEAAQLVLWAVHISWHKLDQIADTRLTQTERTRIAELFRQRIEERLPAPYITGEAYFAGLKFMVSKDVLIPRSPIAELIEQSFAPWLTHPPLHILDLCTGSGCIGIACAMAFEEAYVDLTDISAEALAIADCNIVEHGLEDRVSTFRADLFDGLRATKYDLIVCNPPYVDAEDMASLPQEFCAEPALALASGEDGLDFTRRLLREAGDHLHKDGLLVVEVGNSWAALEQAFPRVPFTWLEFERGGHGVFVLTADQLAAHREVF